ncbi:diguanylate cyclase (GGDEF)-like protein [Sphaerotilus sulfidivorans]|uniref:diguanylate cyclase n=2 Tax=Sphaerotilus sulfidivorans TaxID=639200 RepID=A0ABV2IS97_9BURK|nr:GGDEF domain-containing protein [Sphaerotilus sulfidivorans]
MTPSPEVRHRMNTVTIGGATLRVDLAVQMLERSGMDGLSRLEPGSAAWLQALIDGLCMLSSRDPMTGLVNRRQFEASLEGEIDRVARSGESAMLLLIDIDHFKRVNDSYGHGAGDEVIRAIGRTLQECVRPMDTVARIGGEEFAAVLPNCPASFGEAVADRIRLAIESCRIEVSRHVRLSVTASVGGAFAPRWVRSSARLWMERADQQLYRAKAAGRNRTCMELPPHSQVSNEERDMLFSTMSAFMPDTLDSTR